MLLQTQGITIEDLHQVRTILEVEIAYIAAKNATDEDIAELKKVLTNLELNIGDDEGFAEWDSKFHHELAKLSRNPLLLMLLDSLSGFMNEIRISVSRYPDLFNTVMPDHYEILKSIEARDSKSASKAMRKHLENARKIQQVIAQDKKMNKSPEAGK